MSSCYLGIDISKERFAVTLLGGAQSASGQFSNDPAGFAKLARWLQKRRATSLHACLEATSRYWEALALFLHDQGHQVSVVNPKLVKRHAESIMQRNKTDAQDAFTIADYCQKHQPPLWEPPSPAYRELQALVRHIQALKADRQRERNRRETAISTEVVTAIDSHVAFLDDQIAQLEARINDHIDQHPDLKADKELLQSIPGIGDVLAATFLAEVRDVSRFQNAGQVAAYAGLTPGQRQSGSSLHSPGHLVKWGNPLLRSAFFMPALSAHRWNPVIAALKLRLEERGKSKMTIIVAIMRKLIHLCYGVLKTRQPFDPQHGIEQAISA